MDPLKRKIVA